MVQSKTVWLKNANCLFTYANEYTYMHNLPQFWISANMLFQAWTFWGSSKKQGISLSSITVIATVCSQKQLTHCMSAIHQLSLARNQLVQTHSSLLLRTDSFDTIFLIEMKWVAGKICKSGFDTVAFPHLQRKRQYWLRRLHPRYMHDFSWFSLWSRIDWTLSS